MRDPFNWSLSLGRWWGVVVRVHASFLIFAAATLYLCWPTLEAGAAGNMFPVVLTGFGLLFGSVLLHEMAHYVVAGWVVADWDRIVPGEVIVGPLGGLTAWPHASNPAVAWRYFLAGPAANLGLALVAIGILWGVDRPISLLALLNPLSPSAAAVGAVWWVEALRMGVWINGLLLLVNLLPAFPFDGGRILLATVLMLRPRMSQRGAREIVFWVAMVTASFIMLASLVLWKHETDSLFPTWFALVLLAVVLLVSARRDVSPNLTDPDRSDWSSDDQQTEQPRRSLATSGRAGTATPEWLTGSLQDSLADHAASQGAWPEVSERDEEQQLDDVLCRLHQGGMDSLDAQDRELLRRVSARYRARRGHRT